jgi:hypothetical protein
MRLTEMPESTFHPFFAGDRWVVEVGHSLVVLTVDRFEKIDRVGNVRSFTLVPEAKYRMQGQLEALDCWSTIFLVSQSKFRE